MPRFAANLSMMFTEVPFLDRFEAAAKADSLRSSSCFLMSIRPKRSASGSIAMA